MYARACLKGSLNSMSPKSNWCQFPLLPMFPIQRILSPPYPATQTKKYQSSIIMFSFSPLASSPFKVWLTLQITKVYLKLVYLNSFHHHSWPVLVLSLFPFYRWGNGVTERLSSLHALPPLDCLLSLLQRTQAHMGNRNSGFDDKSGYKSWPN